MMNPALRETLLIVSGLACTALFYLYSDSTPYPSIYTARRLRNTRTASNSKCSVPDLNPWDPSIQKYIQNLSDLVCSKTQLDLTVLHSNGTLYVSNSEVRTLGFDVNCKYRCYGKVVGDDTKVNYESWTVFKESVKTDCEFLEVQCAKSTFPYNNVYSNNHNRIIPVKKEKTDEWKPSVILFVLDSISHSQWRRSLPKTYNVLKTIYNSHIFKGMTKVGDNSFPNAVAFLSGKIAATEFEDTSGFFDDHPLIWKDFSSQGYNTYYAEDYPHFNLFSYMAKGFKRKPVDHYFRPFWLNVYWSYLHRKSTNLCYGNTPLHQLQLNYFKQFIQKYKDSPIFALNWLTELGHDYMNNVQYADEDLEKMFTGNHHYLKDSFVFVLSDHGHRFDAIRQTEIGRMEENLPFFSMHIPERFQELFGKNVKENSEKFTTFWDFHETLRDILSFSQTQKWEDFKLHGSNGENRGQSLLRPIQERSCRQAAIPDEYCPCASGNSSTVENYEAEKMASSLVSHVNSLLSSHTKCARLSLSKVLSASRVEYSEDYAEKFRISLEVSPSKAMLEAVLHREAGEYLVIGDVNRINRYGNQSLCIDKAVLRKFCFCNA